MAKEWERAGMVRKKVGGDSEISLIRQLEGW